MRGGLVATEQRHQAPAAANTAAAALSIAPISTALILFLLLVVVLVVRFPRSPCWGCYCGGR
jgi:hypothetical protein